MTTDERLDRLTERHEALTETVELLGEQVRELGEKVEKTAENIDRLSEKQDRDITALRITLRRAIRVGVAEARNERRRRQTLDEYITRLAASQLITEEKMQALEDKLTRFIDASRRGGNGQPAA
ncbi:MAG: hypothetical protein ACLP59_02100 [Bryobacteraceae bacterium]